MNTLRLTFNMKIFINTNYKISQMTQVNNIKMILLIHPINICKFLNLFIKFKKDLSNSLT